MANDVQVNERKLLALGLATLREQAILPRLVNRAYESIAGGYGSTVTIPVPAPRTAYNIAATATPPATADFVQTSKEIVCNNHIGADFVVTDIERVNTDPQFIQMEYGEAIKAIANNINDAIALQSRNFWAHVGSAASIPLASNANDITQARLRLRQNLTPIDRMLCCAWTPEGEANALALPAFQYVNQGGSSSVMVEGDLGRRLGFDHKVVQDLYQHTTGGGAGWLVNQADHAAGDTTVTIDTGTGDPVVGDLFTVAGSSQQFVVQSYAANVITYAPAADIALGNNAAITFVDSHISNLAFHKYAIAFVNKPLATESTEGLGSRVYSAVDEVSGLVLRLEVTRQNKRNRYEFDVLYGVQTIRPEFGCRILQQAA